MCQKRILFENKPNFKCQCLSDNETNTYMNNMFCIWRVYWFLRCDSSDGYMGLSKIQVEKSFLPLLKLSVDWVAQMVEWLATGWMVQVSNPGGGRIFRTCPDQPWGPPSLLYNGYGVIPMDSKWPEHDPSLPSSAKVWKQSRAIPLLSLRAFVACEKGETYLPNIKYNHTWNGGKI
jgi:hypothetical protein